MSGATDDKDGPVLDLLTDDLRLASTLLRRLDDALARGQAVVLELSGRLEALPHGNDERRAMGVDLYNFINLACATVGVFDSWQRRPRTWRHVRRMATAPQCLEYVLRLESFADHIEAKLAALIAYSSEGKVLHYRVDEAEAARVKMAIASTEGRVLH